MPSRPRSEVIDQAEVGIYHCWNRLVRRRCLFGFDQFTRKNCSHRKDWVRDQFRLLAAEMAIQVLDYAVLDNHLHVVLRNRPDIVAGWSDEEVALRWWRTCPRKRTKDGAPSKPTDAELARITGRIDEYRQRLSSISWMMRLVQQRVARRSNKEDSVEGRFFASRFGCSRLRSLESVLRCSLYVDLNWVHAGMADTPEESRYTSAFERIRSRWNQNLLGADRKAVVLDDWLAPIQEGEQPVTPNEVSNTTSTRRFHGRDVEMMEGRESSISRSNPIGSARVSERGFLPFDLSDYLKLLDAAGRVIRKSKSHAIPADLPPILTRLGIKPRGLLESIASMFSGKTERHEFSPA